MPPGGTEIWAGGGHLEVIAMKGADAPIYLSHEDLKMGFFKKNWKQLLAAVVLLVVGAGLAWMGWLPWRCVESAAIGVAVWLCALVG